MPAAILRHRRKRKRERERAKKSGFPIYFTNAFFKPRLCCNAGCNQIAGRLQRLRSQGLPQRKTEREGERDNNKRARSFT